MTPNHITATLPQWNPRPVVVGTLASVLTEPLVTVWERQKTARTLLPETLHTAVQGALKLDDAEINAVIAPMSAAVHSMRRGVGTFADWLSLAGAVNVGDSIERQGIVKGLAAELAAGRAALQAIADRISTADDIEPHWRAPTLYANEIAALTDLVRWHKYQLQNLSYSEFVAARTNAIARVKSSGGRVVGSV